jgi:hypothetical protein
VSGGGRFVVREGSRGGERELASFGSPAEALERRDLYRKAAGDRRALVFDAIDTDAVDLDSPGILERCDECGGPTLAADGLCNECDRLEQRREAGL